MSDRLIVATKCRVCDKVSARTLPYPVSGDEFPMDCLGCGTKKSERPLKAGDLDDMETSFSASVALQRAGA